MIPANGIPPRVNRYQAWAVCGAILLAIGLIYGQTLGHKFLEYDDSGFVWANPHVTPGLTGEGIWWAFTEGPFGEWYPLAPLSHMLDCQLFGLNAGGHHFSNVLLHACALIALFLVWWRFTDELWPSAFVAAVFAVHPQHVESVAWVSERKDVLSGLFFVLTLGAWLGYVRHGRTIGRYLLVAALFALGLMAKPMLVTLPALLLLLDFWPLVRFGMAGDVPHWTQTVVRPGTRWLVQEKLPLVGLVAIDCLLTMRTHAHGQIVLAWPARIGNAVAACVRYIVQLFCPVDLAVFYPIPVAGPQLSYVVAGIMVLGVISAVAVIWRRRCPYLFVGWFWYLGMLSPVLGLVQVGPVAMADRYTYLPGIGLYIALAWGATRLAAGSPGRRWVLGSCAGLTIVVLVACAVRQTSFWYDDETLWRHALACTSNNGEAELGLANALVRQRRFDEAERCFLRAEALAVDGAPANNLGLVFAEQGRFDEAIAQYRQSLAMEPDSAQTHANLGTALARKGNFTEAREHFQRAVALNPLDGSKHRDLAYVLLHEGDNDGARAEFEKAVKLDPGNASAHNDLGSALAQRGQFEAAGREFVAALAIDPQYVRAHVNLARTLAARGQVGDAATHYQRALELDPNNAIARQELDKLLRGAAQPMP